MARRLSTSPHTVARRVAASIALQYQLRIELKQVQPQVWRRLLVPENVTLAKLHRILQAAMGWTDSHLHEYIIGRLHYGVPDPDNFDPEPVMDERRIRLNSLVEAGARRFIYLYDFGDGWEHIVKIEDIVAPKGAAIQCIAAENACPPEDVGGPHAYLDFLAAIKDPFHEEHVTLTDWIGGSFDPAVCDLSHINARLALIKR